MDPLCFPKTKKVKVFCDIGLSEVKLVKEVEIYYKVI